MKKSIIAILGLVVVLSLPVTGFSQTPMDKLGRGLANTLTGILELPKTMEREAKANGALAGLTTGTVKGLLNVVVRELAGIYEIATFPIPVPAHYAPILDDPEYFL